MKPLKRHPALTQLSMEHHHTLALCLRIMREPEKNHRADITEHFVDLEHHFLEEETLFGTSCPMPRCASVSKPNTPSCGR